jgi:hypothetical protein
MVSSPSYIPISNLTSLKRQPLFLEVVLVEGGSFEAQSQRSSLLFFTITFGGKLSTNPDMSSIMFRSRYAQRDIRLSL